MTPAPTIHATAVLVGARAILIRGPAGAGKSRLALALIAAADAGALPLVRLVADDRVSLEACHGRLLARAPAELAGLIEARGLGIRRVDREPVAVVGLVVDLAATDGERLPAAAAREVTIDGIRLPRIAVPQKADPITIVLAHLHTQPADT